MTEAEKVERVLRYQAGDHEALGPVLVHDRNYVYKVALAHLTPNVDVEDLLSEGNIGMMEAAKRFDPARGVVFLTYCDFWIRNRMMHHLNEQGGPVRRPTKKAKLRHEVDRLSEPVHGPDSHTAEELLPDPSPSQEEVATRESEARHVRRLVQSLPGREASILTSRFGLDGRGEHQLSEIAEPIGLSRERVRQLQNMALAKMKSKLLATPTKPMVTPLPVPVIPKARPTHAAKTTPIPAKPKPVAAPVEWRPLPGLSPVTVCQLLAEKSRLLKRIFAIDIILEEPEDLEGWDTGSKIRIRRTELGLTQSQLAKKVGYTTGYISSIETGRSRPTTEIVSLLMKAVGI